MQTYLDFEKPIAELEGKIRELRHLAQAGEQVDIEDEVATLEAKASQLLRQTYTKLTPWQKTQVARHPDRPHFKEIADRLIDQFTPLAGDRAYADDQAVIGGLGRFRGRAVMVIGTEKGHGTHQRVERNFGMARPEGYRKAQRLMRLADRFGLAVLTFVDTPGAYPGIGAEERGQAEAIARSIETCLAIRVPLIACITGEGGSGGAVALASGNAVLMAEHAIYSVISPEACSTILWKTADKATEAAGALKLTAQDLARLGVVDEIVPEPLGGAHRAPEEMIQRLGDAVAETLGRLDNQDGQALLDGRREKFLKIGRQ